MMLGSSELDESIWIGTEDVRRMVPVTSLTKREAVRTYSTFEDEVVTTHLGAGSLNGRV